jgi:hypothetical protein
MTDAILTFWRDLKFAARSLARTKGVTVTVVLTLALGIGANAAIFSVVRGVLMRPLANRDEDRLIYIRQSARGIGADNATFSVPEILDLRARVKTRNAFGDFSTIGFTMVGLGEPREIRAGVVGGSYFCDGAASSARPAAGCARRRRKRGRCDGPHLSFLDQHSEERSGGARQIRQTRISNGDHRWGARTIGSLSGGNRNYRQRGHQPASSIGDHGDRTGSSDDRAVRQARTRPES